MSSDLTVTIVRLLAILDAQLAELEVIESSNGGSGGLALCTNTLNSILEAINDDKTQNPLPKTVRSITKADSVLGERGVPSSLDRGGLSLDR